MTAMRAAAAASCKQINVVAAHYCGGTDSITTCAGCSALLLGPPNPSSDPRDPTASENMSFRTSGVSVSSACVRRLLLCSTSEGVRHERRAGHGRRYDAGKEAMRGRRRRQGGVFCEISLGPELSLVYPVP